MAGSAIVLADGDDGIDASTPMASSAAFAMYDDGENWDVTTPVAIDATVVAVDSVMNLRRVFVAIGAFAVDVSVKSSWSFILW